MELDFTQLIAKELSIQYRQVDAAIRLLKDGNTIPFIARYRKEATGELDEETPARRGRALAVFRATK